MKPIDTYIIEALMINNESFEKKYVQGQPARWYQVWQLLTDRGPMKKKDIISFIDKASDDDREYTDKLFRGLNIQNVCVYNKNTQKWEAVKEENWHKMKDAEIQKLIEKEKNK